MNNIEGYLYNLATDKYGGRFASVIKFFLFMFSLAYGLAARALAFLCRIFARRLDCRVISVGNITVGGTGKTALVEYIAGYLKNQGRRVVILSRGYKRKVADGRRLAAGQELRVTGYEAMGDEPYMLQVKLPDIPVIAGADRAAAAKRARDDYAADTVILDDGFQQWGIKKDLEIVTIDATNPFGNRCLMPRGILREGLSALGRADIFVLTKTNLNADNIEGLKSGLHKINPQADILESAHLPLGFYGLANQEESFSPEALRGKQAALFSGIADPRSFEDLIRGLGIQASAVFRFGDHHDYSKEDLVEIAGASLKKGAQVFITTEKDAARLSALPRECFLLPVVFLRLRIAIKDEERFHNRLLKLYSF